MVRRIALVYNSRSEFDHRVMAGVAAYFQEHRRPGSGASDALLVQVQDVSEFRSWEADGVIANLDHAKTRSAASNAVLPIVGFGAGRTSYCRSASVPYLFTNNQAIGEMAARHLLAQGFRKFAYVGCAAAPVSTWDEERERAFTSYVAARNGDCWSYSQGQIEHPRLCAQFALGEWLSTLPKPIGVMAANDERAYEVLESCRLFNFQVPREIAVIGVDNNDLLCQLSWPSLSSIERGATRIGYEAAALLDRLMGDKLVASDFVIEPTSVVVRQSTDMATERDAFVSLAMDFIHLHHSESIRVGDVANAAGTSESVLESKFVKVLGRTIHAAIREARLEHARRMVTGTEVPLKQIAPETGFSSVQHMTTLFKRAFGQSPARYRKSLPKGATKHKNEPAGHEHGPAAVESRVFAWPTAASSLRSAVAVSQSILARRGVAGRD